MAQSQEAWLFGDQMVCGSPKFSTGDKRRHQHFIALLSIGLFVSFICIFWLFVDYEETLLTLSVTEASALNFADVWGGTQTPETGLGAPCCAMQRFQLRI